MHFCKAQPQGEFQFVVYDFGGDANRWRGQRGLLEKAGQRLLVCGTKPHELGFSAWLKREFAGMGAWLLCPFVAEGIREELIKVLQDGQHRVKFLDYQPELMDGGGNAGVYRKVVAEYTMEA